MHSKPRLLFFQYRYDPRLPAFLLTHKREHVKCLSQFFDVTVIQDDCDYEKVCEQHQPDLALFESGVNHPTCRRPEITSIRACPAVPKMGLHHGDGFCNARAGFLSDMDHWGIETFFAISTTAAEHTPEMADNLFVWPNFVDPEVYRDHGAWKSIPVLFIGNTNSLYPWRQGILQRVRKHYPSLICPHPGYEARPATVQVMVGEQYARAINTSWFVPACGTVAREVVRKHFEVPACRSCLVTERTAGLDAAGFVDMENCVFADEHDVLDKLDHLFSNPEVLRQITDAGHRLVHSRHTIAHRDQLLQWLRLHRTLLPYQRIVQRNPFEPLSVEESSSGRRSAHLESHGMHLALLREGDDRLWRGHFREAEGYYLKCMSYMRWMPEPKLRLAICKLYEGDAEAALSLVSEPIEFILARYKARDPDPVEWAYYVVSLLCLGKVEAAADRARQFPWLSHPELARARWAVSALKGEGTGVTAPDDMPGRRRTIHQLPVRSHAQWMAQLCAMLRACGRARMAEALTEHPSPTPAPRREPTGGERPAEESSPLSDSRSGEGSAGEDVAAFFRGRLFRRELRLAARERGAAVLHWLERRLGYFLPYRVSEMRSDKCLGAIRDTVREAQIRSAVVLGAARGRGTTEAFLAGALENVHGPSVFLVGGARRGGPLARREAASGSPTVKQYDVTASTGRALSEQAARAVTWIKKENRVSSFDAVLVDAAGLGGRLAGCAPIDEELRGARIVVVDGVVDYEKYGRLLGEASYALTGYFPSRRSGCAIFVREGHAAVEQHAPGEPTSPSGSRP